MYIIRNNYKFKYLQYEDLIGSSGIPIGGFTSQALVKQSNTDLDVIWNTIDKAYVGLGNVDNTSDVSKPVSTLQQSAIDLSITNIKDGVPVDGNTLQKLYNSIIASFTEVVKANIADRNAYNVTHIPTNVFVTDDGDGNWALYKATTLGVGATYVKISDPDLLNAVMTASQIKTSYESNSDTNAFTNALLSKLNSVAASATANISDAASATLMDTKDAATLITAASSAASSSKAASTISEDSTHRFATDAEKITWNAASPTLNLGWQTYTGTPAFTATGLPSGLTGVYQKQREGNKVTVSINLMWSTGATGSTAIVIPMPADVPVASVPTGWSGNMLTANTIIWLTSPAAVGNSVSPTATSLSSTGDINIRMASNTVKMLSVTATYFV